MVLDHNVDLTNEVVFARITFTQEAVEEEKAHIIDCFDGMYGVDTSNVLAPVKITAGRFADLFYAEIPRGSCEFKLAEKSPELVLRAGGYQVDAQVLDASNAERTVLSSDFVLNLKQPDSAGTTSNTFALLGAVTQNSSTFTGTSLHDGKQINRAAAVLSAGGRGWISHYDISFDVLEMVTQNIEDDIKLDRDCWDECSYLRMRGEVASSLDLADYLKCTGAAQQCVMSADELADVLNSRGATVGSVRTPQNPVQANDKLAIEVEYRNGNDTAQPTILRLHFLIVTDAGVGAGVPTGRTGYTKEVAALFHVPIRP